MVKVDDLIVVHTTAKGEQILVMRGKLSEFDFRVYYKTPHFKIPRSPKHVHVLIELYVKQAHNPELTQKLVNRLIELLDLVKPIDYFPPKPQVFKTSDANEFKDLNSVGNFSAEFILVYEELIMIQEKTNYGPMKFHRDLLMSFGKKDRYSVINIASYRGRK